MVKFLFLHLIWPHLSVDNDAPYVTISRDRGWPSCISVRLHPATGDVQEQQYVCLTLELSPPHDASHFTSSYSIRIYKEIKLKNPYNLCRIICCFYRSKLIDRAKYICYLWRLWWIIYNKRVVGKRFSQLLYINDVPISSPKCHLIVLAETVFADV